MIMYKPIKKFAEESGYTANAIYNKIYSGMWPKNLVWVKAPDGRLLISIAGYNQWVETAVELKKPQKQRSRSSLSTKGDAAESAYDLLQQLLTSEKQYDSEKKS